MAELRSLESLRVVVADDHPHHRAGLTRQLRGMGVEVVEVPNGEAAIEAVDQLAPDVVLMDLQMPGLSGLEATRLLTARSDASRVLMLSVSAEEGDVSNAIMAGAAGYVLKDEPVDQVLEGIRAAASGRALISPRVAQVLLRRVQSSIEAGEDFAGGGLSAADLEGASAARGRGARLRGRDGGFADPQEAPVRAARDGRSSRLPAARLA